MTNSQQHIYLAPYIEGLVLLSITFFKVMVTIQLIISPSLWVLIGDKSLFGVLCPLGLKS